MRQFVAFVAVGLLWSGGYACCGEPPAVKKPEAAQAVISADEDNEQSKSPLPAWVAELAEIRRQFGGSSLDGSLLAPEGKNAVAAQEADFAEALRQLDDQSANTIQGPTTSPAFHDSDVDIILPDSVDRELTNALRHAARLLDDKANRLECTQEYRQADRYRGIAHRLRREARHLSQEPTTR